MQQRLALLSLLTEFTHVVEQFFNVFLLFGHLARLRSVLQALGDVAVGGGLLVLQCFADLLLGLRSFLCLLAELLHFVGKLLARLLSEIFLHLLEFALCTRRGVRSIGELLLFELLDGLIDLFARLFELLLGLGHILGVLRLLHAVFEIIEIAQELFLLGLETFQLIVELLLLLVRLRLRDLVLQFLHLLRQRLLPAGEFLEPVQNLQVLLLLGALRLRGDFFLLVALFLLLELQVHQLIFIRLLACAGLRRAVLPHHLMLAALSPMQPFECSLLKRQSLIDRRTLFLS